MLALSITLFAIAVLAGIFLITFYFLDGSTPRPVARTHGVIAIIALILLIIFIFISTHSPIASMIVLVIAGGAGVALYISDKRKKPLPKWFPLAHAFVAAVGFFMLLWFML